MQKRPNFKTPNAKKAQSQNVQCYEMPNATKGPKSQKKLKIPKTLNNQKSLNKKIINFGSSNVYILEWNFNNPSV